MCAPSPPPAPDYAGAAKEQGVANKEAAVSSSRLNNPNVISPYGTQTYTEAGDEGRPTLIQTLSPDQQALLTAGNQTKLGLSNLAQQGTSAAQGVIGAPVDFSGTPGLSSTDLTAGAPGLPGDAASTREKVINAMMGRVDTDTTRARDIKHSNLIAAGIRPGSQAYAAEMDMIDRGYNDARQQALLAGGQEASRDYQMDMGRRQQAIQEAISKFGTTSEARRQAITELLSQRQIPLNEITALMSGSQVSNPFATPNYAQNANIQAAPIFAAKTAAGDWEGDIYNARAQQAANLQSGLFGLGGAGLMGLGMAKSDRRLKTNIVRIGTHPLGIGLYEYDLLGRRERGVMADEVVTVKPSAAMLYPDGYWRVDYSQLGGRPA